MLITENISKNTDPQIRFSAFFRKKYIMFMQDLRHLTNADDNNMFMM